VTDAGVKDPAPATDLVVQGAALAASGRQAVIEHLERVTGIAAVPAPCSGGVRFPRVVRELLEPRLAAAGPAAGAAAYDIAFVPAAARFDQFALMAFDMDSTLITIECIDELAALAGIKEVAAVTASAMRGEIPFAESLRRRVALLAGLPESALERVYRERLRLSPGAETLLEVARAAGVATLLVSGGFTWFTQRLRRRLGIDRDCANTLEIADGVLTGRLQGALVDGDAKAAALRAFAHELGARREQVMVIGDGANDLPMMREGGVAVAFHAKPVVRAQADFTLDHSGLEGVINLFPPR
jgi:phosphoserine phosphatase